MLAWKHKEVGNSESAPLEVPNKTQQAFCFSPTRKATISGFHLSPLDTQFSVQSREVQPVTRQFAGLMSTRVKTRLALCKEM